VSSPIFREIKQSIGSGEISSLPKEKLVQFSAALAQSQAYTYFSAPQFPQICKTVELHLAARLNEESLAKVPNPTPNPSADKPNHIHNIGVGVLIVVLGAAAIWVIAFYLGVQL